MQDEDLQEFVRGVVRREFPEGIVDVVECNREGSSTETIFKRTLRLSSKEKVPNYDCAQKTRMSYNCSQRKQWSFYWPEERGCKAANASVNTHVQFNESFRHCRPFSYMFAITSAPVQNVEIIQPIHSIEKRRSHHHLHTGTFAKVLVVLISLKKTISETP